MNECKIFHLLIITAILGFASGCYLEFSGTSFGYDAEAELTGDVAVEEEFDVFEAHFIHGEIRVAGVEGDEISVNATAVVQADSQELADEIAQDLELVIDKRGGRWELKVEPKSNKFSEDDYSLHVSCTVSLPSAVSLDLSTTHADVDVRDISGFVEAATSHGAISLTSIEGDAKATTSHAVIKASKISGNATFTTSHANIEARDITGEEHTFTTSHGDVKLDDIRGTFTVTGSHSNVEMKLVAIDVGRSKVTTTHGDVALFIARDSDATISMTTSFGEVTDDFPGDAEFRGEEDRGTLTIGDGGGKIDLVTTHGDISVKSRD
ncbi:MAG: DUF4097 domain-containing protein [Planctomycetes bacterium]|nr:DUF4097 domain-containing protein [Planctomycetota bacterium]